MLVDAHLHLQEPELAPHLDDIWHVIERERIGRLVVNGTHPGDWEAVARLAEADARVVPSFGVHPWQVNALDEAGTWLDDLRGWLERFPQAGVGEVGLDRWIRDHDLAKQQRVLNQQLNLASELRRPATIHCLKAFGPLLEILQRLPDRQPFLLHSYGGAPEMIVDFTRLGAYFSFSPYFMDSRKERQQRSLLEIPPDRLLLETDAPAMAPPVDRRRYPLPDYANGQPMNHPGNLAEVYAFVAERLDALQGDLETRIARNLASWLNTSG